MTGERDDRRGGRRQEESAAPACETPARPVRRRVQARRQPIGEQPAPGAARAARRWTPDLLIERLDGDEALARQLVTLFIGEYPKLLAALHDRIAAGDADQVRRAAHALKGCVSNFVDDGPRATAFEIECMGAEGRLGGTEGKLLQLERELADLVGGMREFESRSPCEF